VLIDSGPEAAVEQRFRAGGSLIMQRISIRKGSREIRFACSVDWQEEQKNLRVQAETNLKSLQAAYEIQFGLAYRPTHENTGWDKAMFEVPGQRFADLSQPDYGFAVLNDCKYGHYIRDGIVDLSLLRSPKSPDPEADIHEHEFTYSYYPHPEDLAHSDVLQKAHELNSPPLVRPLSAAPDEGEKTYFSISGGNVVIDTVKPAYRGGGRILRLYESMGTSCSIELKSAVGAQTAVLTDLLERELEELKMKEGKVSLSFTPFEIKTLLLK
jgi:alpha-mannosidase